VIFDCVDVVGFYTFIIKKHGNLSPRYVYGT
jgi:hypothetical protein